MDSTYVCERNVVDIKNEYTLRITQILKPLIYQGIEVMYTKSEQMYDQLERIRTDKQNQ
jgi:hypothetical protein